MENNIKIFSSKIKFEDLLRLVDRAINTGKAIQIKKSMLSQNNNTMRFIKWVESHKIISIVPIEIEPLRKMVSIRSRKRKVEISLQMTALGVSIEEISKKFKVKINTVQSYFKELDSFSKDYLFSLSLLLRIKAVNSETNLTDFPSFPIRINLKYLRDKLPKDKFDQLISISEHNKFVKKITGQKLGTTDISFFLPEKLI